MIPVTNILCPWRIDLIFGGFFIKFVDFLNQGMEQCSSMILQNLPAANGLNFSHRLWISFRIIRKVNEFVVGNFCGKKLLPWCLFFFSFLFFLFFYFDKTWILIPGRYTDTIFWNHVFDIWHSFIRSFSQWNC